MGLSSDVRGAFGKLVKANQTVASIAKAFNTTSQAVYRWLRRGKHRGQKPSKTSHGGLKKVKSRWRCPILKLRAAFKWGTARIQQGLTAYRFSCLNQRVGFNA